MQNIADAVKLKANPKLIKPTIEATTGKKVMIKDISNIKQQSKTDLNRNSLETVMTFLKEQPGSITEVAVDVDNTFLGLSEALRKRERKEAASGLTSNESHFHACQTGFICFHC